MVINACPISKYSIHQTHHLVTDCSAMHPGASVTSKSISRGGYNLKFLKKMDQNIYKKNDAK